MYKLEYSNDNIYTGDIGNISDIKYVNVIDFDYNFISDKSIISDYTNSTASVCFYKNKGTTIFSSGRYKEGTIDFSNETFYQCLDLNHNFDNTSGYKSSSSFFGASNISFHIDGNGGLKISFDDVYNTVNSIWVYVNHVTVYVKTNDNVLYERDFDDTMFEFSIHDKKLIINSETIATINGSFLPYSIFKYGDISNLKIETKYSMPMVFEGTGEIIDDIYGDVYCITKPASGLGYLKSKADNVLVSSNVFAFDIACRAIGDSIPFSISESATFGESGFIMNEAGVWVHFDTTSSGFNSNIVTTSGIVTISGVVNSLNDYYLIRCYYDGTKFGTIVNGVETSIVCDNVTISGSNLNIITNNLLNIDSFAFYTDTLPTQALYGLCLIKFNAAVSGTALVNSNDSSKFLFAADNFYPENYSYAGLFEHIGEIPITHTNNVFYTQYSIAGGETSLFSDNFYASRLPFTEAEYNCFVCENDKTFLTYFSGIVVPVNKIIAESFTNYNHVSDDFITTNSGLYIRNYSKVFNPISSASIIEFLDVGWASALEIGVLCGVDVIPSMPSSTCVAVTASGNLYIGTSSYTGINVIGNNSIYFYFDGFSVVVSGSSTGVLGTGSVGSYEYMRYFTRNSESSFAGIKKVYVSTVKKPIDTLTNKFFSYTLPEYYNLNGAYKELFYDVGINISSSGIVLYDYNFHDHQCSFSSYYDTTFSGMFNIFGYNFLGINDNFENGFITERWRLVCDPYGVYSCNQPGWISCDSASCPSCHVVRMYDGDLSTTVHHSTSYVIAVGNQYILNFPNDDELVDAISIYVTSHYIDPPDGFVISCDVEYRHDSVWYSLLNNYVSPTLSGISWPIRHDMAVPIGRYDDIKITANSNWGQVVPTEIRPSCLYNYGGTAVCTISGNTCVHVALDDVLHIYSEYTLEDYFSNVSLSGINYYPLNSKLHLKDYSGKECYVKTNWTSSGICDIVVSSGTGSISTSVSGLSDSFIYIFHVSRNLDIINLEGYIIGENGGNIFSNYAFSSDDLGLDLVFYNKSDPNVVGSGCLFRFGADDYTVNFSSIAAGYKYTALDGTDNITKTGVGFNTYPPNLFVDKIAGSHIEQSHRAYQELTASGFQLVSNIVDNNVSIEAGEKEVGGVQQISKFNRLSLFSDYVFMPTIFYRIYIVGENQQYTSFSDIASLVKTGDKVYFYPGSYIINTDKQISVIGIGNPIDVRLSITNASNGLTVMGCTTTRCAGSNVFNLYNCYILPWNYTETRVILYDVVNINFYNCCLYNYLEMSYAHSYVLLHKCTTNRSIFRWCSGYVTVYNEGYSTRGYYGYGPEFNRASIISGLSHVDSIVISSFYYNSAYNHFPLHNQKAIGNDLCNQIIASTDAYTVYFYGDIKKLNSFSMYLFIQDLDGTIEIMNSSDFVFIVDSTNLSCGIRFTINVYGAEVDMVVPISHSNVFKLSVVSVVFDGGAISIYLNGAKLATKYIIVTDFNDADSYLNDSVVFFDEDRFTCDGDGLLLKGASLQENIHFLVGTHVEELYSNYSTIITINMELSIDPVLADYHDIGTSSYYGYSCRNTGVGLYYDISAFDNKHIHFNAEKSYKVYKNMATTYIGKYRVMEDTICKQKSDTAYVSPQKTHVVTFRHAGIDNKTLGYCDISEAYGYVNLSLQLPVPAIDRTSFCFDIISSVLMLSFDQSSNPYCRDVGPNSLSVDWNQGVYGRTYRRNGIFHYCSETQGNDYFIVDHNNVLNLTSNFTMEFLFTHFDGNGFSGYLLTKGTLSYSVAYRVGINDRHIPYFTWSWEGDNTLYANKSINIGRSVYLAVVVGENYVSFYINGVVAGTKYTDKLTIINNSENLRIGYGYPGETHVLKQIAIEEVCILNTVKTATDVTTTWEKIAGSEEDKLWIKINNIVVVSDKPINVSPSDRCKEVSGTIDTSKWEYTAYRELEAENGIILDSRTAKKLKSKIVSYNVIFDVSVFCEFLEYSVNRNWSVTFKYKFVSGNYISVVIDYVKYDDIYVKCEYYYNGYKNNTSRTKLAFSPCGIRFVTDYNKCTYVQIGDWSYWFTLWTSTQNLFLETSGQLEINLSNDDWDSWFIVKITDFLPRLYCGSIADGDSLGLYEAVSYGRAFYNQISENVATLCLSNAVFEIDASDSCVHALEFINGQMSNTHVLDTTNRIFDNVNYETFNIELLVYLTYSDTSILDLFPWININVKDKYLYVTMHDNDRTITDSIDEFLNDYIYIAVSIGNPHTTIHINNQEFIYDTNFSDVLPYHFYPIGKNFSGRVVYFCGYYGNFDTSGYNFRVSALERYIGFDIGARKIFGSNMVTSLDPYSIIYAYDNPSYSSMLASKVYSLGYGNNIDVEVLYDPAILQSSVSSSVIIRCKYSSLAGKKTTSITVSATKYNVSHNYYGSFGHVGDSQSIFSYDLSGTCYDNDSIFILDINKEGLEDILKGIIVLNVKNNETNIITNIYIYLNSELSINDIYGSSLLV